MGYTIFHHDLFWQVFGLLAGLSIVVVVLGEMSERLEQRGNPLAQGVRLVRHVVVPLLAVLYIIQYILGIAAEEAWVRGLETLFWITVMYAGLRLIRNLTKTGEGEPEAWVHKVPGLLFVILRALLVVVIASHVFTHLWGFDLSKAGTGVAVGSMVIAFALQDTLSNLVSGFLLLADRPFQVGDRCLIGDRFLTVQEVGWRTTRFAQFDRGVVIVPNGSLGKETIINHGRLESMTRLRFEIRFSYDDPPNLVKQVLMDVLRNIDEIKDTPAPAVRTFYYQEYAIAYRVVAACDFRDSATVRDKFMTQLYYTAKRHNLTIPLPARALHHVDRIATTPEDAHQAIMDALQAVELFRPLPIETLHWLVSGTTARDYGAGERVVCQGESDEGVYVIQNGSVTLSARDTEGQEHEITTLAAGTIFGEMVLLRDEPSPVSATVTTDARVLVIDHAMITRLIVQNNQFARDMHGFVEERRRAMRGVLGTDDLTTPQAAHHDVLHLIAMQASRSGNQMEG
ncbi:MAG: cyclic nucleotide-binding domain-containing protein [Candidatus Tectomicrobia bacterium]